MTPQDRAEKCAALMFSQDTASQGLDMVIEDVGTGHAKLSMSVGPNMLNGHGICHGGYIFTLADSAFAFACNTYNQLTVAQQNQITYIEAGKLGECLIATATETSRTGRSGTYAPCCNWRKRTHNCIVSRPLTYHQRSAFSGTN